MSRTAATGSLARPLKAATHQLVTTVDAEYSGLVPSAFSLLGNGSTTVNLVVHAADQYDNDLSGKATTIAQEIVYPVPALCYISASAIVEADTALPVTIGILDADGNGIPDILNTAVLLASTGTGNTITQPSLKTNEVGETNAIFESSVEEVKTLSATIDGVAIPTTFEVTVGTPPSPPAPGDPFYEADAAFADADGFAWTALKNSEVVTFDGFGCLRCTYSKTGGDGPNAEPRFNMGRNLTEVWIDMEVWFPVGYTHKTTNPSNDKFIRIWGTDYGDDNKVGASTWYNSGFSPLFTSMRIDRTCTSGVGPSAPLAGGPTSPTVEFDATLGAWTRVRLHYLMCTSTVANDALAEVWIGETKVISWDTQNALYDSAVPYWLNGYLFGAANTVFPTDTHFYIKEGLAFYESDPGWDA